MLQKRDFLLYISVRVFYPQEAASEQTAGGFDSVTHEETDFVRNLWNENHQFMRNKIGHLGVRESEIEDVLMDCFLDLIRVRTKLSEMVPGELRAYISIAVRNRCQRWHYLNNRMTIVPWEEENVDALSRAQIIEDNLIVKMDTEYQTALLLSGLSDRDKMILFGHFLEGLSDEELAKSLRCKKNSVRSLLSRAKKNAKAILSDGKGEDSNG